MGSIIVFCSWFGTLCISWCLPWSCMCLCG